MPNRILSTPAQITVLSNALPAWRSSVPVSSYASIPMANPMSPALLQGTAQYINNSYSALFWSPYYGTHGGMLMTGGGHANLNFPYSWVFDPAPLGAQAFGWRFLNVTPPSGVTPGTDTNCDFKYAEGSEFSHNAASMPADARAINTYDTNYLYKPQGADAPWGYPATDALNYGECATGVPMGFHTYNALFPIPPNKLGMGPKGGWGCVAKASCTRNSALGSTWGHKIDAATGAWSRMSHRVPPNLTGGGRICSNYLGTWLRGTTRVEGDYSYSIMGESARSVLRVDLNTDVMDLLISQNSVNATGSSTNGWSILPGTHLAFMCCAGGYTGNSPPNATTPNPITPQLTVQGINLDGALPNAARSFKLLNITNNTLPRFGMWDTYWTNAGAAALMWVPEVGKFALFGASTPATNQVHGTFPLTLFWLTPPADVATTWDTGAWTMEEEALTVPAGDTVAASEANRGPVGQQHQSCFWSSTVKAFLHLARGGSNFCFFIRTSKVP